MGHIAICQEIDLLHFLAHKTRAETLKLTPRKRQADGATLLLVGIDTAKGIAHLVSKLTAQPTVLIANEDDWAIDVKCDIDIPWTEPKPNMVRRVFCHLRPLLSFWTRTLGRFLFQKMEELFSRFSSISTQTTSAPAIGATSTRTSGISKAVIKDFGSCTSTSGDGKRVGT